MLKIIDLGDGKRLVLDSKTGRALPQVQQVRFVAIRQRTQQHRSQNAEDRCVRADAKGKGKCDGDPEHANAPEGTNGNFQIAKERHDHPREVSTAFLGVANLILHAYRLNSLKIDSEVRYSMRFSQLSVVENLRAQ